MKKNTKNLWATLNVMDGGGHTNFDGHSLTLLHLIKNLLTKKSGHLTDFYESGTVEPDIKEKVEEGEEPEFLPIDQKYYKYMVDHGGRLLYKTLSDSAKYIFLWKDGIIDLDINGNYVTVSGISYNESLLKEMKIYFQSQWVISDKPVGHIYAVVKTMMGLSLSSLGNASIPLIESNYTPNVIRDYKYVVRDLLSESPSGRITIMRGTPGTGKTHLIRALLLEVPDAMFVLVSPDMVIDLPGPELLPLLLSQRGETTGPIVLVLEDADKCLVSRDKENMNAIQSLLNLGDGILGSLLDLRIIATTNAEELLFDKALERPGRLSKMLEVGPLDLTTARGVFQRLLPEVNLPKELSGNASLGEWKMILAETYALARKHGWVPEARKIEESDKDDCID